SRGSCNQTRCATNAERDLSTPLQQQTKGGSREEKTPLDIRALFKQTNGSSGSATSAPTPSKRSSPISTKTTTSRRLGNSPPPEQPTSYTTSGDLTLSLNSPLRRAEPSEQVAEQFPTDSIVGSKSVVRRAGSARRCRP